MLSSWFQRMNFTSLKQVFEYSSQWTNLVVKSWLVSLLFYWQIRHSRGMSEDTRLGIICTRGGKTDWNGRIGIEAYLDGEDHLHVNKQETGEGNDRGRIECLLARYGNGNACNLNQPGRYLVKLFACERCSCQRKVSPGPIRPSRSFRLLRAVYLKHWRNYVQTEQVSTVCCASTPARVPEDYRHHRRLLAPR